jgi:hypothetical protein
MAEKARRDRGQFIKWAVYALLVVNFGYYLVEEIYIASYTLQEGDGLYDWAGAFATTFDEFAWLSLLFLFELETYQLSDQSLERRSLRWTLHGFRALCYLLLAHTVVQWMTAVMEINDISQATEVASLCQLADGETSFGKNYRYQLIDASNCRVLSGDDRFYFLEPGVITDRAGYTLEKKLVWVDLNDACMWLVVVLLIELSVRLQDRGVSGRLLDGIGYTTYLLYGVLFAHAIFWFWMGHWVYAWDQALWIGGFWLIGRNLSEWRDEIKERGRQGPFPGSV